MTLRCVWRNFTSIYCQYRLRKIQNPHFRGQKTSAIWHPGAIHIHAFCSQFVEYHRRKVFWGESQHGILAAFQTQCHLTCMETHLRPSELSHLSQYLTFLTMAKSGCLGKKNKKNTSCRTRKESQCTATPLVTTGLNVLFSASQICTWSYPQTPEWTRYVTNTITSPGYHITVWAHHTVPLRLGCSFSQTNFL